MSAGQDPRLALRSKYTHIAASQTAANIATNGALGDIIDHILVIPETTAAGNVSIKDGSGSAVNIFAGGTVSDLKPIFIPLGVKSVSGRWTVNTAANVHVIVVGQF